MYFVTQSPSDIPESVLGQLGNRVQHALRAFTPHDQKAVKVAAETLRKNPAIDTERAITELAVGEALVSLLDEKGSPGIVERAWMLPPSSQIGPIADGQRDGIRKSLASMYGHYDQTIDRESAYEKVKSAERCRRTSGHGGITAPSARQGLPAIRGAPADRLSRCRVEHPVRNDRASRRASRRPGRRGRQERRAFVRVGASAARSFAARLVRSSAAVAASADAVYFFFSFGYQYTRWQLSHASSISPPASESPSTFLASIAFSAIRPRL